MYLFDGGPCLAPFVAVVLLIPAGVFATCYSWSNRHHVGPVLSGPVPRPPAAEGFCGGGYFPLCILSGWRDT